MIFIKNILKNPQGFFGLFVLLIFLVICIFASQIKTHDPNFISLEKRLLKPYFIDSNKGDGIFGKDSLGRDVYSMTVYGTRVSLIVGILSVSIGIAIGVPLGLISGYMGGIWDLIIMGFADIQYSIPFLVLLIAVIAFVGGGIANVIIFMGIASWVTFARVVRSEVLKVKSLDYIDSAKALGYSNIRIIFMHILPNVSAPLIVVSTLNFGNMILTESALSFMGLGVEPTIPSWGRLLAESRAYINTAWWPAFFPGISIFLIVLSANLLGDSIRDYFDPKIAK